MKDFLKENLLWMLIPFLLALAGIAYLMWKANQSGPSTEFVYGL